MLAHFLICELELFRLALELIARKRLIPIVQKARNGRLVLVHAIDAGQLFGGLGNAERMAVARRFHARLERLAHLVETVRRNRGNLLAAFLMLLHLLFFFLRFGLGHINRPLHTPSGLTLVEPV